MEAEFEIVKSMISQRLEKQNLPDDQSEEARFIEMIADRVAVLMETNMELLFNHLYRMDVDERKIRHALNPLTVTDESVYVSIARLIYARQKLRLETKAKYKQDNIDFWGEE